MITLKEACKIGEKECGGPIVKIIETNTCWVFMDEKRVNRGQVTICPMVKKETGKVFFSALDIPADDTMWQEIPVPTDY